MLRCVIALHYAGFTRQEPYPGDSPREGIHKRTKSRYCTFFGVSFHVSLPFYSGTCFLKFNFSSQEALSFYCLTPVNTMTDLLSTWFPNQIFTWNLIIFFLLLLCVRCSSGSVFLLCHITPFFFHYDRIINAKLPMTFLLLVPPRNAVITLQMCRRHKHWVLFWLWMSFFLLPS